MRPIAVLTVLNAFSFLSLAFAQPTAAPTLEAILPVKIVGNRLVARCELSTKFRRIPANLIVDYERPCGLELHNRAADPLGVDRDGGQPVTIHCAGFSLQVKNREHGDEDFLSDFTRFHSVELGEVACVGFLGGKVMGGYHMILDLAANQIVLRPPSPARSERPPESSDAVLTSCDVWNDQVWFPIRLGDETILQMALGTSRFDSVADEQFCGQRGKPAGDIGPIQLKEVDFHRFVAFRPEPLIAVHPDGALGTTGINLLKHFRVEVDRVNRWIRWEGTAPPQFPTEDLEFFRARIGFDPAPLEAWLQKHPDARLAVEAADLLLERLLDQDAEPARLQAALEWVDRTRPPDLRATMALRTMKSLLETQKPALAMAAGELGIKSGRADRYPESVHKLHAKLGELMVEDPEHRRKAWEHLLSAAFGLPEDGMINLLLGRFYELEGRQQRAMSRFVQAVIQPESGPLAIAALERLQRSMDGETLSVDLVDQLITGKVHNFQAATRFDPTNKPVEDRTVLVELFTNAHFGRRLDEGWMSFAVGGALGIEGLLSHFTREHVAVLSYHVPQPEPTALQNELSMSMAELYQDERPVYTVIDGASRATGASRWRDGEKVFEENRAAVVAALAVPTDFEISIEAKVEGGVVDGVVTVKGPQTSALVQIVLAERGVLYPGKAQVIVHRMVARAALTGNPLGIPYRPEGGSMRIPFRKALDAIKTENEQWLSEWEQKNGGNATRLSTTIDPRQIALVAFVRDRNTREILQSAYVDPVGAEPKKEDR